MKSATRVCTLATIVFLLSKMLFASWKTPWGDLAGAAFVVLGLALLLWRMPPETDTEPAFFKKSDTRSLLLFCPFFVIVWALGFATEQIGSLFNLSNEIDVSEPVCVLLLCQVLLAALCEELTFRYFFLRYLAHEHAGAAVLLSAIVFALMHVQILQIPYAFIAGLMLGALTVCTGSVFPAFLFHFGNNAVHLLSALYGDCILLFTIILCLLGTAVALLWKNYRKAATCAYQSHFSRTNNGRAAFREAILSPLGAAVVLMLLLCVVCI